MSTLHDTEMKLPPTPQELTPEWLTWALRQAGALDKATVVMLQAKPPAEAKGIYGQIVRITLSYDRQEAGAPPSLIAKFSSAIPVMRQRAISSYQREIHFYQELAQQTELPTATCYYAAIDIDTGNHILLLQDLAPAHSGSRVAGCSPEQAQLAIEQIANFHAKWWQSPQLSQLAWLPDDDLEVDAGALKLQYETWWPLFCAQINERLPAAIREVGEKLGSQRAHLRQHLFGSAPRTLIHRDYQLDNLIFATAGGGVAFAVLDWQFISRGRGIWDVAYFLSESLLPDLRRSVEMKLLARYHQSLVDQGVQHYPFEQALYDYRLALLQRFTALVSTIAVMPFSEEQRQLHINILLPRNSAAILDHDAGELLL